jgi:hypothetical protein
VVIIRQHRALLQRLGLATCPEAKTFRAERVKDHRGRRDILRLSAADESGRPLLLYVKRNWRPYKKDGLKSLLRHGRVWSVARQEWENADALERAGLRAAPRVAFGEECGPLWERFSFLVTEAAAGAETVEHFLRHCHDPPERRRVFDALAREVRRLHDAGLATPDLFSRHVFVERGRQPPAFCWIDVARLDRRRRLPGRLRARDLAALNVTAPRRFVSRRERLRFFLRYAGGKDRRLLRQVVTRTRQLLKRRRFADAFEAD